MRRSTGQALVWIVNILRGRKARFQIFGGFAANVYGSNLPLADIDIWVPDDKIFGIAQDVKRHITYGPKRYKDRNFDILLMTLKYKGQEIDIAGADTMKLFDNERKKWARERVDLKVSVRKRVYGLTVPVIPLKGLIRMKKKLGRRVDVRDIRALSHNAC